MPEVPELNVMGLNLKKSYKGHKVKSIEILWKKRVVASQQEFTQAIEGQTLQDVFREGKHLHLKFSNGSIMGIHLMLTGKIVPLPSDENVRNPIFELLFDNGTGLVVADGLGQAKPILNPEIPPIPDIEGKDFTLDYFRQIVSKRKIKIKELIQDQKVIRGIGNAYADEILWHAKISPWSVSNKIPDDKVKDLYKAIREITKDATAALDKLKESDFDYGMENKDHRFIHNSKRKVSPDGEEILTGKVGNANTYYTESQLLYE